MLIVSYIHIQFLVEVVCVTGCCHGANVDNRYAVYIHIMNCQRIHTGILLFVVPAHSSAVLIALSYIFTVFVSFQGVAIFILFVPFSKPVRDAYSKWWKEKVKKHRYESTKVYYQVRLYLVYVHYFAFQSTTLSNVCNNITSSSLDNSLKLESSAFNSTMETSRNKSGV